MKRPHWVRWPGPVDRFYAAPAAQISWGLRERDPEKSHAFAGFGFGKGSTEVRFVAFPLWLPAVLLAYPPGRRAYRWARRRRWRRAGWCPACGYDLRGTPGRCPECGAVPASGKVPA